MGAPPSFRLGIIFISANNEATRWLTTPLQGLKIFNPYAASKRGDKAKRVFLPSPTRGVATS